MSAQKTFQQQIDDLQREVLQLDDHFDGDTVKETAVRLETTQLHSTGYNSDR